MENGIPIKNRDLVADDAHWEDESIEKLDLSSLPSFRFNEDEILSDGYQFCDVELGYSSLTTFSGGSVWSTGSKRGVVCLKIDATMFVEYKNNLALQASGNIGSRDYAAYDCLQLLEEVPLRSRFRLLEIG